LLDSINAWSALPLQLIGFGLAIWQIRKALVEARQAKTAAESARDAAKATQESIANNNLLILLPQCQRAESDLEWAIRRGDPDLVIHYLGVWRWQAGQLRSLLAGTNSPETELLSELQNSIAICAQTKIALQSPGVDVLKKSKAVQLSIANVTGKIGELAAQHTVNGRQTNGQ
jgi:hypothetical protein